MADAGTIGAAISGLVSLLSAYMTYRVGMADAEAAKPDDDTLQKGESALNIVRTGVSQYGTGDEKADLSSFERNPQRYAGSLQQVLADIAARYPVFQQELESFARQNDIRAAVQGTVKVSGQGKIYGNAFGVNQGNSQGGTYHINEHDETA